MVSTSDDVDCASGESGENANQHVTAAKRLILKDDAALAVNQCRQCRLHILLTHQRLTHQHRLGTGSLHTI